MMADELLNAQDLITAKKHDTFHSEVITGKTGGLSTGANIDYATNAVTAQVQKTLPKILDDLDWSYVGLFADGVTFTDKTDFAVDAVGTQWIYTGSLPFSATAGTVPSEPTYQVVHVKSASAISNANGGSVQDFIDDAMNEISGVLRLQSFGDPFAGDASPVFDAAILTASILGAKVICPHGDYAVSKGINIKPNVVLEFQGAGSNIEKTQNETTSYLDYGSTYNLNTVFFVSSGSNLCGIKNVNITGTGVTTNDCHAVVTGKNVSFFGLLDVRASSCKSGMYTAGDLYMSKIRLHTNTCGTHIDFSNSGFKTSTIFENCWAENCGLGYIFNRLQYSSLSACGADYVARVDGNPYSVKPWNDATSKSVYDFNTCEAVDITGCGSENSCGQFAINYNASTLTINSFRSFSHTSKYTPNYATYANYHVGIIGCATEGGRAVINGVSITDGYTNPNAQTNKIAILSYNYLSSTYGVKGYNQVTISGYNKSSTIKDIGGLSSTDVATDVLAVNTLQVNPSYSKSISGDRHITYAAKFCTGATGTQVIIPFISQGSSWRGAILDVTLQANKPNSSIPYAGSAKFGVASLNTVNVTQYSVTGIISSVTASGLNIILNLTGSYTEGVYVVVETLFQVSNQLNHDGITMN